MLVDCSNHAEAIKMALSSIVRSGSVCGKCADGPHPYADRVRGLGTVSTLPYVQTPHSHCYFFAKKHLLVL